MRWSGATVVCIASGPSLIAADCELVRGSGCKTIVVNTSFRLAPWANILYAGDRQWWSVYGQEAKATMRECWTASIDAAERHGIQYREARDFENSGYQAIELAAELGASRIVLLGYDCQHSFGKRHWHTDHPADLGNADGAHEWPDRFAELAERYWEIEIVNASRQSALTCFRRMGLKEALC